MVNLQPTEQDAAAGGCDSGVAVGCGLVRELLRTLHRVGLSWCWPLLVDGFRVEEVWPRNLHVREQWHGRHWQGGAGFRVAHARSAWRRASNPACLQLRLCCRCAFASLATLSPRRGHRQCARRPVGGVLQVGFITCARPARDLLTALVQLQCRPFDQSPGRRPASTVQRRARARGIPPLAAGHCSVALLRAQLLPVASASPHGIYNMLHSRPPSGRRSRSPRSRSLSLTFLQRPRTQR